MNTIPRRPYQFEATDDINARRQRLLDQLVKIGPEHFDQGTWIMQPIDYDEALYDGLAVQGGGGERFLCGLERAAIVDVNRCGTVACLAGHGAVVMADTKGVLDMVDNAVIPNRPRITWRPDFDQTDIGEYFDLPASWFSGYINPGHPGYEAYIEEMAVWEDDDDVNRGSDEYIHARRTAEFNAQVHALTQLIAGEIQPTS